MTRLVLVRHGESACNLDQVVGGHRGCTGLSELGRRQVEALAQRWQDGSEMGPVSALYSSVLPRAMETAEILAPALGDLALRTDCGLCEVHPGEADGLPWAEVRERWGPVDWSSDPDVPISPGGESWTEFGVRAGDNLAALARRHSGETVVVACHGGVVRASMPRFLGAPLAWRALRYVAYASVTEWEQGQRPAPLGPERPSSLGPERPEPLGPERPWALVRYNDAGHLAGVGAGGLQGPANRA